MRKLLAVRITYLCEEACSKLITIMSKNRSFLKNVENVLRPPCLVLKYAWMICVKIIEWLHLITCA